MCENHDRLEASEERTLPLAARRMDTVIPPLPKVEARRESAHRIPDAGQTPAIEDPRSAFRASAMSVLADEAALPAGGEGKHARLRFRDEALRRLETGLGVHLPKGDAHKKYGTQDLDAARTTLTEKLGTMFQPEEVQSLLPRFLRNKTEA
ncbi:hypothetical protein HY463_00405 [Candidatus Peregrinibacteria bacterium]|nr:hypothetical protein [Candidatus Peregrinibacteria bacterium]